MDPCPVLIGRENEMAALRSLLDAGGGVAIVSGEAGIGKSRLVREFAAEAASRGRVVLWGRPEEVAQPGPYALIVDLLESIAEAGQSQVQLDAHALASLLSGTSEAPGERSSLTTRSLAAQIRGLVSSLPVQPLYVLEDLHRADESSHGVVLHLARSARDDAHTFLATYRSDMLGSSPSLERLIDMCERERIARAIRLTPLGREEVQMMLESLFPDGLTDDLLGRIVSLGEGIPFFIEELADAALTGTLPRSVELTVENRLAGLDARARESIRAASLMVGVIDPGLLADALDLDRPSLTKDLLEGTNAGLLADRDGRLIFRHALVRDAVSAGIVSIQRSDIHTRLARAIEVAFSAQLEPHSAALAFHWEEAGNAERASEYHLMAGERALSFAATVEARSHFVTASSYPLLAAKALRGLAEVEFREGNDDEAAQLFRANASNLSRAGDLEGAARDLSRLAWAIRNKGASDDVFRTLDEALGLLEGMQGSSVFAELLVQKGQILSFHFGRFTEAKPILERAVDLARDHNDLALVAQSYDGLAQVADAEGMATEALEYGEAAMRAANESRVAEVIGRTFNNHAVKLASFGRPSEGLKILASGRDHLLRTYGSAGVSVMDVSAAWSSWLMGLPGEVALLTARGKAAWQRWRGYRSILEVWSALEGGQLTVAQARLQNAWTGLGGTATRDQFLEEPKSSEYETRQLAYAEGLLLLHLGNPQRAVLFARAVVAFDRESFGESFDVGQGLLLLALALVQSHEVQEAQQVLKEMEALLAPVARYPFLQAHVLEVRGLAEVSERELSAALECYDQADELLRKSENQSDRARVARRAAEVLPEVDTKNGREEAIKRLRSGLKISEACGALAEMNHIEADLRAMGVRPRAGRPRRSDHTELTPRETEVAVLVAAGTTNARIAEQLFLSERTVQDHITNALRKLGVTGRAGLAAWAARQGLV